MNCCRTLAVLLITLSCVVVGRAQVSGDSQILRARKSRLILVGAVESIGKSKTFITTNIPHQDVVFNVAAVLKGDLQVKRILVRIDNPIRGTELWMSKGSRYILILDTESKSPFNNESKSGIHSPCDYLALPPGVVCETLKNDPHIPRYVMEPLNIIRATEEEISAIRALILSESIKR